MISPHHPKHVMQTLDIAGAVMAIDWLMGGPLSSGVHAVVASAGPRCSQNHSIRPLLSDIACPSARICYAVGASPCTSGAAILRSGDGGRRWQSQPNPLARRSNVSLQSIACPGESVCFAAGTAASILATFDGGRIWRSQRNPLSGTYRVVYSVACPSVARCYAVGDHTRILATGNAGRSWHDQPNPLQPTSYPRDVACPSVATCYIVGGGYDMSGHSHSTIIATTNGGYSWRLQRSGSTNALWSIACPANSVCYAAGDAGTIVFTRNGGKAWTLQISPLSSLDFLSGIACRSTNICYAVGGVRPDLYRTRYVILATRNGGALWSFEKAPLGKTTNYTAPYGIACPATNTCFVVGGTRIVVTTDGGKTWRRLVPWNDRFVSSR